MALYEVDGFVPEIGSGTYVCDSASVIGNVKIGSNCFVAPGARLRGDYGRIEIGEGTSVEDNCVIHARPGETTRVGSHVTLGHSCVLHNCTVEDYAVIGAGAIVSDWAVVGQWTVVAEGALVRNGFEVPAGMIAVGVPAKLLDKMVSEGYKNDWLHFKGIYERLASDVYPRTFREVPWKFKPGTGSR
ncbi:MAG: hypothetical protein A2Y63_01700 [Candidatus Riflebacteria bacterium RBG_13_59_9]|nr:MAG: hypothetical protein A2Y63_01700 [Candidatus Riflebacteria bacterium RBG_13_59_9]